MQVLKEVIYQISEELSYLMYQGENQRFYLTDEALYTIIERLSKNNPILRQMGMKEITQHCYAFCCYWKANTEHGAVEFLHNNIRDFFLAEKIYRELDRLLNTNKKPIIASVVFKLAELFQYGVLETKVVEFIYLRALYNKEHMIQDCTRYVCGIKDYPIIISELAGRGILTNGILDENSNLPPIEIIKNTVTAAVQVFRYLNEPYLKDDERLPWNFALRANPSLLTLFKAVFAQVPVTITENDIIAMGSRGDYSGINFVGCDLRNIDFRKSDFSKADLSDTVLCGSDFGLAKMQGAKFNNADMHYSCLKGAILEGCDLTGCDLRGTDLPDGFVSTVQEEQVEHLRKLGIKGLSI